MKNEAVRIFFAVTALLLVAMLTSPAISETTNKETAIQRKLAALETLTSPISSAAQSMATKKGNPRKKITKKFYKKRVALQTEKKRTSEIL